MQLASRRGFRWAIAASCTAAALVTSGRASAWYFPEHVVITHDGLVQLPREIRAVLHAALAVARRDGLALCDAIDVPLEELAERRTLTTKMVRSDISVA